MSYYIVSAFSALSTVVLIVCIVPLLKARIINELVLHTYIHTATIFLFNIECQHFCKNLVILFFCAPQCVI